MKQMTADEMIREYLSSDAHAERYLWLRRASERGDPRIDKFFHSLVNEELDNAIDEARMGEITERAASKPTKRGT